MYHCNILFSGVKVNPYEIVRKTDANKMTFSSRDLYKYENRSFLDWSGWIDRGRRYFLNDTYILILLLNFVMLKIIILNYLLLVFVFMSL